MLESSIQAKILKYLKDNHIFSYKNITCNKPGIPDITTIIKGKAVFFEVKRNDNIKLSVHQLHQKALIEGAGGYCYKVTSLNEVKAIVESFLNA